jgi:hypothetical protein
MAEMFVVFVASIVVLGAFMALVIGACEGFVSWQEHRHE